MTHDLYSTHQVAPRRSQGRDVARSSGEVVRAMRLMSKIRRQREGILAGNRGRQEDRRSGSGGTPFDVIIPFRGADAHWRVTETRESYIVGFHSRGKPLASRAVPKWLVDSLTQYQEQESVTRRDQAFIAVVVHLTLDYFIPTPDWVRCVRVNLMGKPVPQPDDGNAPDYDREGDGGGRTLMGAIEAAFEDAGCDRFGMDKWSDAT